MFIKSDVRQDISVPVSKYIDDATKTIARTIKAINPIMVLFLFVSLVVVGSINLFEMPPVEETVVVDHYEFDTETEQFKFTVGTPIYRNITVERLTSDEFINLYINDGDEMTVVFIKHQSFDLIDRVFNDSQSSEIRYDVSVKFGDVTHYFDCYCKGVVKAHKCCPC